MEEKQQQQKTHLEIENTLKINFNSKIKIRFWKSAIKENKKTYVDNKLEKLKIR